MMNASPGLTWEDHRGWQVEGGMPCRFCRRRRGVRKVKSGT